MSACFVEIKEDFWDSVNNLEKRIKEVEKYGIIKGRKASTLNILVYEGKSKEMVRIKIPIWLLNFCIDIAGEDIATEHSKWEFDLDLKALKKYPNWVQDF